MYLFPVTVTNTTTKNTYCIQNFKDQINQQIFYFDWGVIMYHLNYFRNG